MCLLTKPLDFLQTPANKKFFIYMSSLHAIEARKRGYFVS